MNKFIKPAESVDFVRKTNGEKLNPNGESVAWDTYMRRRFADGSIIICDPPEPKAPAKAKKPKAEKVNVKKIAQDPEPVENGEPKQDN